MFGTDLKISHSEEKFQMLFELSPIGMAMIDHETGEFLEVNQALLDIVAYTKEEFLALSFWDITPRKYEEQENQQIEELDFTGKFGPNEKEYIRKDGTLCPIKIRGYSFIDVDGRKVVWGLIEDISISKQYEIIYQDNKELLEYIAIEKSLQKILDKITHLSEKRSPHTFCSILLLDESGEHLLNGSAPSLPDFYNEAIHGIEIGEKVGSCGSAAFKKQRVIVENIDTHENWQPYLELTQKANLHSCWSEPIISSDNKVLGTFAIYHDFPKSPTEFELKLIETYAKVISKALEKHKDTKRLKKSEEELAQLFNNSASGLLYVNEHRLIVKANESFTKMMGYDDPEELVGLSAEVFHLTHRNYVKFGKESFYTLSEKREASNIEYELKRKDGSTIWCEFSGKVLDDKIPADLSKGVLWTISDVSLRKEYESQVQENQLLLKSILNTIPNLVWLKNIKGEYLACNPAFESFIGLKNEKIVGKTDFELIDKELADFFEATDQKAMNSEDIISYEKWLFVKNRELLFDISKKAMRDAHGNAYAILGIGNDVTLRKLREKKLEELNALAQSLTSEQQDLLSLFDKGDSVLFKWKNDNLLSVKYVSKGVDQLLGVSKEQLQNENLNYLSFIHKDYLERVSQDIQNIIEKELDYYNYEPYKIVSKDGEEKWVLEHMITQRDEKGEVKYFIGYITDITKQIENQNMLFHQSKIASLGEMLGNISHQWRQPLSIISSVATGTKFKKEIGLLEDEEFVVNMDSINENAQYLSTTIDDFRNFFLGDTHTKEEVLIKDSLKKVISLIKDSYKSSNIQIVENLDEEASFVYNENLLIQALINIFNNAKDALNQIEDGEFDRYVFVNLTKQKDGYLIEIRDNAGGIEQKYMDKLFEPYFTTKHKSLGTGIGLYMTNQIVLKHLSGSIFAKTVQYEYLDENYKGASFNILITP